MAPPSYRGAMIWLDGDLWWRIRLANTTFKCWESVLVRESKCKNELTGKYFEINFLIKIPYIYIYIFQEYEETCLFTKHESLQGDSP